MVINKKNKFVYELNDVLSTDSTYSIPQKAALAGWKKLDGEQSQQPKMVLKNLTN